MSKGLTLVTGGGGFIGRRVLRSIDRALVRTATGAAGEVVGDLCEMESLLPACEGVAEIFHCAGYAHAFSASDTDLHWKTNLGGTQNLLTAAGRAGVQRFIFLSSVKAMAEPRGACVDEDWPGEPVTPYGQAKRAAEDAVLEAGQRYGMHVVNLRLAMVYGRGGRGNLERIARGISAGWFPPLPETHNQRSLVHVDDVVTAMRLVAEREEACGRTYIVADGRAYSGSEIYNAICLAMNIPPSAWRVPATVLRAGGLIGDLLGVILDRSGPLNSEVVERLLESACYLPTRIERELGWQAKINLINGVCEMVGREAII